MAERRRAVLIGSVVTLLAVVAAVAFWPRGTTEVTESEALSNFRDRAADTSTTASAPVDDAEETRTVPEPGVYTFLATGQEEVKLGPLPTETRPFPDTVTAVVAERDDGCFELTVNLFAEHTEDTRYCSVDGTLTLDAHTKHQRIGPLSPTATMACDPAVLTSPDATKHGLSCTLELSGGPKAISASLAGSATRGKPEQRTIGTETVEATPLTVRYEVTGDLSGTWTETLWLTEANLAVRIERNLALSGPASFTERSTLDLQDLTPNT